MQFTPDDHFGGTGAHLLDADCDAQAVHDGRAVRRGGLSVGELVRKRARPARRRSGSPSRSSSCSSPPARSSRSSSARDRVGVRPRRPRAGADLQVERRVQLRPGRVRHASPCARCTCCTPTTCRTAWPSLGALARGDAVRASSPSGSSCARCSTRRGSRCSSPRPASPCWPSPSRSGSSTAQGRPIARAFPRLDRVTVLGVQISDQRLWLIGTLAVLAVVLGLFFTRTNLGLAIIGASQEPTATELVGISVRRLSTFTWVLAALLGGLAAVIAVPDTGSFTPGVMTSGYLIPAFTAAVLGGMTSLPGRVPRRRARRHHPVGRHERRRVPGHPRHAVDADRVPRAARRARRAPAGPAREVGLMTSSTTAPVAGRRAPASAAEPFRPSAGRLAGPRRACGPPSPTLVLVLPARPARHRPARVTPSPSATRIVALSLNVLLGYVGQISLGHAAFVGIGAFTSAYLVTVQGQSFWVGVLAAAAIGGAQALVLGGVSLRDPRPVLRPHHAVVRARRRAEHLPDPGASPAAAPASGRRSPTGSTPSGATTTCAWRSSPSCCTSTGG